MTGFRLLGRVDADRALELIRRHAVVRLVPLRSGGWLAFEQRDIEAS